VIPGLVGDEALQQTRSTNFQPYTEYPARTATGCQLTTGPAVPCTTETLETVVGSEPPVDACD
jgi:hypothetical protein